MSVDDELIKDYREVLKTFSDGLSGGRRVSKNEAILSYIRELHEIWYFRMIHHSNEVRGSFLATLMSKSVSMLLEEALKRVGKAILSERSPNFSPTDDGDDLGDEFTAVVLTRQRQLELELGDPQGRDSDLKVARCVEEVRQAMTVEFDRQRSTSWAQ